MHAWGLRLRRAAPHSRFRTSRCCLPICLTSSASLNLAISELTTSGYPAYMCLFPTLQVHPLSSRCPHMGRGQDGSLLLSCMTLSFTTPRRFIPTLSRPNSLLHQAPRAGQTACSTKPWSITSVAWFLASRDAAARSQLRHETAHDSSSRLTICRDDIRSSEAIAACPYASTTLRKPS